MIVLCFVLLVAAFLGFLALQAGQAQNRFYNDLEEWLSGLTRLGGAGIGSEGDQPVPAFIQALLEQTADNLENLQRTLARGEDSRIDANRRIGQLTEVLSAHTEAMQAQQGLLAKLAETQSELQYHLAPAQNIPKCCEFFKAWGSFLGSGWRLPSKGLPMPHNDSKMTPNDPQWHT